MDVEDFTFGDREIGILHLWELDSGSADKPRVRAIVNANLRGGIVVCVHCPRDLQSYTRKFILSPEHFTLEEADHLDEEYA
jgi:hypothetical protein